MRRRWLVPALTLACLSQAGVHAGPPVWAPTHPVQQQAEIRLAATPDGGVWAVVDHNRVLRSADAGRTWMPVNPVALQADGVDLPYAGPVLGGSSETLLASVSSTQAWAANGTALSRTVDAGTTWRRVATPSVTKSRFFESAEGLEVRGNQVWYFRSGSEVVGYCPYPLKTTPVLISHNAGASWTRSDLPVPGGWAHRARFVDARRGVALVIEFDYTETTDDGSSCGYSGTSKNTAVMLTTDGGRTWRRSLTCPGVCFAASWVSASRVVVGSYDGQLFSSDDGGRRFQALGSFFDRPATPYGLTGLDFVGRRGWAAVNGVGVFRSDDGGSEWVKEVSTQDAFFLAIVDLTAVDQERAVTVGPYSLLTRSTTPGVAAPGSPPSTRPESGKLDLGGGRSLDVHGVLHVAVSMARSAS
jgi:photosystem II stability/assembly factor-like uncharacterized protein